MSNVDFALFHTTYLCWLLFEYACVIFACFADRCYVRVVYTRVGRRYKDTGEVLSGYRCVCLGAFKYQHRLAKIAQCTFNF